MNIDKIPEEFEKIIDTEMNRNPIIYNLYKKLTDCGLNNTDDCSEHLAKGLVMLLLNENKALRGQLLRMSMRQRLVPATQEHGFDIDNIRQSPTFVTSTPESMSVEEFGKRYSLASSIETGRKLAEELNRTMIPDEYWSKEFKDKCNSSDHEADGLSIIKETKERIDRELAAPKEVLGMPSIYDCESAGEAATNPWLPDTDTLKALRKYGDNIKFHAGNVRGDRLYLAETYKSIDGQPDLLNLIWEAEQNRNAPGNFKIEVSPESKKQIMSILDEAPSTFNGAMAAENIFGGMRVEELVKRDGYFIGICYDI